MPPDDPSSSIRRAFKDSRLSSLITWGGGVVAAALMAGLGWATTHLLSAENVNLVQDAKIQSIEVRASEDRTIIRDQLHEQSQKLDRIMERIK